MIFSGKWKRTDGIRQQPEEAFHSTNPSANRHHPLVGIDACLCSAACSSAYGRLSSQAALLLTCADRSN